MEEIISWLKTTGSGHYYYFIALASIIPLFLLLKKKRKLFLIPLAVISILCLSPVFYKIFVDYAGEVYWRTLWLLPIIPLCATLPCVISEKIKEKQIGWKVAIVGLFAVAFMFLGTFIYADDDWGKCDFHNSFKIPNEAAEVADYLLSLDDNPRAVIVPEIVYYKRNDSNVVTGLQDYIRQYTGKINLMFGRYRYIDGYSDEAMVVYNNIKGESGDCSIISEKMLNDGYSYLVVKDEDSTIKEKLKKSGFIFLNSIEGYAIYEVYGDPTITKKRNDLGQVISATTLDEYGNPINNDKGYATVEYKYDSYGNIIREFWIDAEGQGVADSNGYSGWERQYNYKSQIVMERYLNSNGLPAEGNKGYFEVRRTFGIFSMTEGYYDAKGNLVITPDGYAKIRRKYNSKGLCVKESYYDTNDNLRMSQNGYAQIRYEYDENKLCIREKYYDDKENTTMTPLGYAEIRRLYDDRKLCVQEMYYDSYGDACIQAAGYSGKGINYDDKKRISSITYLDEESVLMMRNDGYSEVRWEENQEKETRDVVFYDLNGNKVSSEGLNLVRDVQYGEDGWSKWMTPQKNKNNCSFNIGMVNLGPKDEGDAYTCYICIEFQDVTATNEEPFMFLAQGSSDGKWDVGNIWDPSLIYLDEPPCDGVYYFKSTAVVNGAMTHASEYGVGFRCDNWNSGSFRVKEVMVIKGKEDKEWTPGL